MFYVAKIIEYYDKYYPISGGIPTYIHTLAHNMPDHDFDIVTDAIPGSPARERSGDNSIIRIGPEDAGKFGFDLRILNKILFPYMILADIERFRNKRKYFLGQDYSLIHFHGGGVLGSNIGRFAHLICKPILNGLNSFEYIKKPRLLTIHGIYQTMTDTGVVKKYEDTFIQQFDTIICVDKNIFDHVNARFGKGQKSIYYIPNPVDTKIFHESAFRDDGRLRIGFIGRLSPDRGIDFLVELIKRLPGYMDMKIIGAGS